MIKIAGLDLSKNSSGISKFVLNEELEMDGAPTYIGFSTTKKNEKELMSGSRVFHYKKEWFKNGFEKNYWFRDRILDFVKDCEYVAIEGYAYAGKGEVFDISEFTSTIKNSLYDLGIKMRIYDPNSIKMFAVKGNADKLDMYEAILKMKDSLTCFDMSDLPIVDEKHRKKGVSPTSDIVDSYFIARLLWQELKLRKALVKLKDLPEAVIRVFNRVTDSQPVNILDQDFISKEQ